MEKPNFDYQTLDQALEAAAGKAERDTICRTNPEGFGPATKKAFETGVYDVKARDVVMNNYTNWSEWIEPEDHAKTAVDYAQMKALEILAARELVDVKDVDDIPAGASSINLILACMKGESRYDRDLWQTTTLLGAEKVNEIGAAVAQDLRLTVEEAENLSLMYEWLWAMRENQLRDLGWNMDHEPIGEYLRMLGQKRGEPTRVYLRKAKEHGLDKQWFLRQKQKIGAEQGE
jgi:hypothetical protein